MTDTFTIVLHLDVTSEELRTVTWWADSPEVKGWTAGAETLFELRGLVEDGLRFYIDRNDIAFMYVMDQQSPVSQGPREIQTVNQNNELIPQSRGVHASTLVTA